MEKFIIVAVLVLIIIMIIIIMYIFYRLLIGEIKVEISRMLLEDFKFWSDEICDEVSVNFKRIEKKMLDNGKAD